jgi:hypothetical protein
LQATSARQPDACTIAGYWPRGQSLADHLARVFNQKMQARTASLPLPVAMR